MIHPPPNHEYHPAVQDIADFYRELERPDLVLFSTYEAPDEAGEGGVLVPGALQTAKYAFTAVQDGIYSRFSGEQMPEPVKQFSLASRFQRYNSLAEGRPAGDYTAEFLIHEDVVRNDRFEPSVLAGALRRIAEIAERRTPGVSIGIVAEEALRSAKGLDDVQAYNMTETSYPLRRVWLDDLSVQVNRQRPEFSRVPEWRAELGKLALPTDATISFLHTEALRLDRV